MNPRSAARAAPLGIAAAIVLGGCTPLKDDVAVPSYGSADASPEASTDASAIRNGALSFGGAQYASTPGAAELRMSDLTVELWINAPAQALMREIIARPYANGTADSFAIWYDGANLNAGINSTSTADVLVVQNGPYVSTWTHVALTFDHASMLQSLYVNGALMKNAPVVEGPQYDAEGVLVGSDAYFGKADYFLRGDLDEVRLWSIARSADAIQATMHTGLRGDEPGLEAYWPFDEVEDGSAIDHTGHGHALVLGATGKDDVDDPTFIPSTAPVSDVPRAH